MHLCNLRRAGQKDRVSNETRRSPRPITLGPQRAAPPITIHQLSVNTGGGIARRRDGAFAAHDRSEHPPHVAATCYFATAVKVPRPGLFVAYRIAADAHACILAAKKCAGRAKVEPSFCFQADDEGSIPFTRSNVFNELDGQD